MAVNFGRNKVAIVCDACGEDLVSYIQLDMPLTTALNFADNYQKPIFCRKCSEIPDIIPSKEFLN